MEKSKRFLTTKRITRIAIFSCLLFVQEEILTWIPNVQLTQCLIAIYYFGFGLIDTLIIVFIHVLLDNLVMGGSNPIFILIMLIGWETLPFLLHLLRKIKNKYFIATLVGLHGIIYSLCFAFGTTLFLKASFIGYLISDILWEVILVVNGFLTTLILLNPLVKILKNRNIAD